MMEHEVPTANASLALLLLFKLLCFLRSATYSVNQIGLLKECDITGHVRLGDFTLSLNICMATW
jgi:hypothetical protein